MVRLENALEKKRIAAYRPLDNYSVTCQLVMTHWNLRSRRESVATCWSGLRHVRVPRDAPDSFVVNDFDGHQ